MSTTLLAALNAILWLGAFVWLYQAGQHRQRLQHRLEPLEQAFRQPPETSLE